MNPPKIDLQDRIQQNHGLIGDCPNHSSQYFGNQQNWNVGIRMQPPVMYPGFQQQEQNLRPTRSCSSMMGRFESPASAFYATELYMGFQQCDGQVASPSLSSQFTSSCDSIPSQHSFKENYPIDFGDKSDNSHLRNSNFHSISNSNFSGDNCYKSYDKSCKKVCITSFGDKHQPEESKMLLGKGADSACSQLSAPLQGNHDHNQISLNRYISPFPRLGLASGQEKHSPRYSSRSVSVSSGNSASAGTVLSGKTRIRWTRDLHEKFVECVNHLGGAEKATPKAILKLMDSDGLTIFHVKSHLQKYRIAKYMPDSSEGRTEKRASINDVSQLDFKTGFQLREALQLQLDVQRRLHEQLEIQRNLQLCIEEQGKQLKRMFDQQQKSSNSLLKNQNLDIASQDGPIFSPEDFEVSTVEGSNNTRFPSKIS